MPRGKKFRRRNPVDRTRPEVYIHVMALARERMIDRMLASDPAYDGRFLTGVLTTGRREDNRCRW